jgi:hypothetical protein
MGLEQSEGIIWGLWNTVLCKTLSSRFMALLLPKKLLVSLEFFSLFLVFVLQSLN